MSSIKRKHIPFLEASIMLFNYAKTRVLEQIKLVAFVIFYLVAFQTLILAVPLTKALSIGGGIALVIFGLAFFLEGLILGLMPIGERVGVKLPSKVGVGMISAFGLLLGFGATLAEPAMSALKTAGSNVTAWDAPLLYMLLERYTSPLVLSVGIGVGIAVAFGMFRFYYGLSLKPFIFTIIPAALLMSFIMSFNQNLSTILGLAWDSGAVTTGAVTVPLVLALGIGVSRASGKGSSGGGFGVIMLASAFPVLSVLSYGLYVNTKAPAPTNEATFFAPAYRDQALLLFDSDADLLKHAFTHGGEAGRKAFFSNDTVYTETVKSLKKNPEKLKSLLGKMELKDWLSSRASNNERKMIASLQIANTAPQESLAVSEVLKEEGLAGMQAVIPLSALLLLVLLVFLKQKLRYTDEVLLGIGFALIGMTLLTAGIRLGLAPLGAQVGTQLPIAFRTEEKTVDHTVINNFNKDLLIKSIDNNGVQKSYFYFQNKNELEKVEFKEDQYDEKQHQYEHFDTVPPMFDPGLTVIGIMLVFIFAFGLGFGATVAEPGLNALGKTVEDVTVGTIKRSQILIVVSIGVGIGLMTGVARIMYDIPTIWLIVPPYLLLLVLTYFSEENFNAIAWDCGGVTTGPVTVPLVLAMGLSIGTELKVIDGFGVLALASVYPIVTVLLYGLYKKRKQQQSINNQTEEIAS